MFIKVTRETPVTVNADWILKIVAHEDSGSLITMRCGGVMRVDEGFQAIARALADHPSFIEVVETGDKTMLINKKAIAVAIPQNDGADSAVILTDGDTEILLDEGYEALVALLRG